MSRVTPNVRNLHHLRNVLIFPEPHQVVLVPESNQTAQQQSNVVLGIIQ